MKRIKKKLVAVILAVNMLVIGIFGSYQTTQAAEIVAGYGAAQILESILLSFGISIFTADMIKNGSSATWWDTDGSAALQPYYDDLEQAYEEQRFKVINGGGGQNPEPSPTPAPGNTPIPFPTTVPVPGDIPAFKELVAPALAGTAAFINMTQGAWECMGKAVSSFGIKLLKMGLWMVMMYPKIHMYQNNLLVLVKLFVLFMVMVLFCIQMKLHIGCMWIIYLILF